MASDEKKKLPPFIDENDDGMIEQMTEALRKLRKQRKEDDDSELRGSDPGDRKRD